KLELSEQVKPVHEQPTFTEFLEYMYLDSGGLKQHLPNYVYRKEQKQMSKMIYDAFQQEQHAIIEAETGAGKSLAYALPAIYRALRDDERIIVSTYTTQLQTQLYEGTLKTLKTAIDRAFQVVLLKGKHHYLSLKRFRMSLDDVENNYD